MLVMGLGLAGGGCAAPRASEDAAPEDFAFGVIVPPGLASAGATPHDQRRGALLEPACYIVESDGVLRAAFGRVDPDRRMPPIVRRVSRDERERLFRLVQSANLLSPNAAGQPVGDAREAIVLADDAFTPDADRAETASASGGGMVGVWWSAAGRRRSFAILPVQRPESEPDPATPQAASGPDRAMQAWGGVESSLRLLREWSWRDAGATPVIMNNFGATEPAGAPSGGNP
jgi:hypothetical protein